MGLLLKLNNGDTQFKSLGFGKDRPGGGDSGQPFIPQNIQTNIQNPAFYNDFIVRGGVLAPLKAAEDVSRLTKYFTNIKNPSGLLFVAKQNLLSRVGTKTEASKGLGYAGGALNEGAYTPLSTLAEAGVVWAGGHLNKQGLDPTGLIPGASIKKYGNVAYENNKSDSAPPEVPDSLYRKEQRAEKRYGRKIVSQFNQEDKTVSELTYRPPTQVNFLAAEDVSASAIRLNNLTKFQDKVNSFLKEWDDYRNDQALKKYKNSVSKTEKAGERAGTARDNVTEVLAARPVYSNRLLSLWDTKNLDLTNPNYGDTPILYSYGGGPNSVLGIGKTNIKFATLNDGTTPARTGANMVDPYVQYGRRLVQYKTTNIFGKTFMPNSYGSVSLTYAGIYNTDINQSQLFGTEDFLTNYNNTNDIQSFNPNAIWQNSQTNFSAWQQFNFNPQEVNLNSATKEDFRTILDPTFHKTFLSLSPSYKKYMIESDAESKNSSSNTKGYGRIGLKSPGQKGDISNYTEGKKDPAGNLLGPVDYINALPIYRSEGVTGEEESKNDLVKFRIAILDNDGSTSKFYMHFRAFLDDFSDSYGAEWKGLEYMGRGEKFYKYGGFKRDISVSFTVVALSKQELIPMYKKLNYLASSLAPSYSSNGYLRGNIAYLTVGAWCYETPGIINSIDYTVPEESPWEIAIPIKDNDGKGVGSNFDDNTVKEIPHMIKVSMKFTPIHNFRPKIMSILHPNKDGKDNPLEDNNGYGNQRYISLANKGNGSYNDNDFKLINSSKGSAILDNGTIVPLQSLVNENTMDQQPTPPNPELTLGNQSGEVPYSFQGQTFIQT